jgi:predicted ArsR family transcriptional regulator
MDKEEVAEAIRSLKKCGINPEVAFGQVWAKFHNLASRQVHELPSCDERKKMAVEIVYANTEPMNIRQISDKIDVPPKAMQNILAQLVRNGKLAQASRKASGSGETNSKNQTIFIYSKPVDAPKFEGRRSAASKRIGQVIELMQEAKTDFSTFELSKRLGISISLMKNTIHYMKQDRLVETLPKARGRGKAGQHASTYRMREVASV